MTGTALGCAAHSLVPPICFLSVQRDLHSRRLEVSKRMQELTRPVIERVEELVGIQVSDESPKGVSDQMELLDF
jgi:hypothetical protein